MPESRRGPRVTLVTSSLGAGGAERALTLVAEGLQSLGYGTTVITVKDGQRDFYRLPAGVARVPAGQRVRADVRWFDLWGQVRRLRAIRSIIVKTKPDALISFQDGVNELVLLSCMGTRFSKLISCQNDISQHRHSNRRWEAARRLVYPLADRVVFLDGGQAEYARRRYPRWRCDGIPNPIPLADIEKGMAAPPDPSLPGVCRDFISAMGRLAPQKGFDLLIRAFARMTSRDRLHLVIIGDGAEKGRLQRLARDLGVGDRVLFTGLLANPFSVISRSRVFAFSSRYEGQGLALIEAMACGVAAVSFDCPSGPGLVIESGRNGLLVAPEDTDAMASAIDSLVDHPDKAAMLARNGQETARSYSTERIAQAWHGLIQSLLTPGLGAELERST